MHNSFPFVQETLALTTGPVDYEKVVVHVGFVESEQLLSGASQLVD